MTSGTVELTLKTSSPFEKDVSALIDRLDSYQKDLYPPKSNHLDTRKTLAAANCKLIAAHLGDQLVGIGAAKVMEDYGELKRFFVLESFRGKGIAESLLALIEKWLVEGHVQFARLETGIHQQAAIRFYEKLGYLRSGPFGDYKPDPLSVFMEKDLESASFFANHEHKTFYIVSFASRLKMPSAKYTDVAEKMVALAKRQPGFMGLSSHRQVDGQGITASFWEDLESIRLWRQDSQHLEAQRLGRQEFYSSFKTTVARVSL